MFRLSLALAAVCLAASPVVAAPAAALNKTVTVSFTTSGLAQREGEAAPHSFSSVIRHIIYVSQSGRLFARSTSSNGKKSKLREDAPDVGSGGFAFQGNRIVGVRAFRAGARQVIVDFDSSFSSCTASIIEGKQNGIINRVGASGNRVTETNVTSSSPSCSIQAGNGFAS